MSEDILKTTLKETYSSGVGLREISPIECRQEELRDHFPEAFSDGVFDASKLMALLRRDGGADDHPHRFGLDWAGKDEAIQLLRLPGLGALRPQREESINFDSADHVFVTGENLEVMKLLQKAYFGAFRMIYMDPPYNTGSDLIYNDDYSDPLRSYLRYSGQMSGDDVPLSTLVERDGRFHSRWLSMMFPRLFVARNLLAENGVIFVSIDDHESHHLRMLMDEVFGPENFVCTFIWEKRYAPPPDTKDVGYVHENILCYRRSDAFQAALLPMTEMQKARYKNPDQDKRGPWKAADYTCRYTAKERPTLYYAVRNPNTGREMWPKKTRVWACSQEEHKKNELERRIWWGPDGKSKVPAKKKFLSEIRQGAMPTTLLRHEEVGHTDEATKELRKWFPELKVTPKPTRLIRRLLHLAAVQPGDLVLDCFAGTGTTAEAVIDANEQDSLGAKFVLIQLPEPLREDAKRSMADVARDRALRRIKALPKAKASGLRCFSLGPSSFRRPSSVLPPDNKALAAQLRLLVNNVEKGRTEDDLLFEVLLRAGFRLTSLATIIRSDRQPVYSIADGLLMICLQQTITRECLRTLLDRAPEQVVCLDIAFQGNDQLKTNTVLEMRSHGIEFHTL